MRSCVDRCALSSPSFQRIYFDSLKPVVIQSGAIMKTSKLWKKIDENSQAVAERNELVRPGEKFSLTDDQKDAITGRIPAARMGDPADIAGACVYLASEEASYVTGQTLHVNGGMAMI